MLFYWSLINQTLLPAPIFINVPIKFPDMDYAKIHVFCYKISSKVSRLYSFILISSIMKEHVMRMMKLDIRVGHFRGFQFFMSSQLSNGFL